MNKILHIIFFPLYFCKNGYMITFFDISTWGEKKHFQTKGTRDKCIVENPENSKLYYFKTSIKKEKKDYKYEFWSEIIASSIGNSLGFNVLKYDIASKDKKIGCISESMNNDSETLTEGVSLLTGYDNTYNPDNKNSYAHYTLDLIENSLRSYNMQRHIEAFYKMLLFDYIIGNSDRHQENWGIISETTKTWIEKFFLFIKRRRKTRKIIKALLPRITAKISKIVVSKFNKHRFAPIYDSGCCLAREIDDHKISKMLKDEVMLNAFIYRASSEIRKNDGTKYKHLELIQELRYRDKIFIDNEIKKILSLFNKEEIKKIINNIDSKVPNTFDNFKLPAERKELIIKIVTSRINKLEEIIT